MSTKQFASIITIAAFVFIIPAIVNPTLPKRGIILHDVEVQPEPGVSLKDIKKLIVGAEISLLESMIYKDGSGVAKKYNKIMTFDNQEWWILEWIAAGSTFTTNMSQDPRQYFEITDGENKGSIGYLLQCYSDGSGGNLERIDFNDKKFGKITIDNKRIQTIEIDSDSAECSVKIVIQNAKFCGNLAIENSKLTYLSIKPYSFKLASDAGQINLGSSKKLIIRSHNKKQNKPEKSN